MFQFSHEIHKHHDTLETTSHIISMNCEHILSAVVNLASSSYGSYIKNVKTHKGSLAVSLGISVGHDRPMSSVMLSWRTTDVNYYYVSDMDVPGTRASSF